MSNIEISRAERLDSRVVAEIPELSRAFAAKLIGQGKVMVNGVAVLKPGHKLKAHDEIAVDYDLTEIENIPSITLPVIYEDKDCVVIIKPAGLLTHSKGVFNPEATVASWLRSRMSAGYSASNERAGIVHRLDRATSGVMICAKTPAALSALQKQFALRKVKKSYQALIKGTMTPEHAIIDKPIERNPKKPQTFRVGNNGKSAVTEYEVLESIGSYSLVELKPVTGRTHQLRVHLTEQGHPIVGDTIYGGEVADRLYLHARSLEITLPNRQRKVFVAPLPEEFQDKLNG